ncbi:hypothetical protein BDZ45DRAFT_381491 [Acephala macrosclerotiorum]|nr:hypothetical protein BDZ45DRAFT_381491 [Acephala macrosclerotiorum]
MLTTQGRELSVEARYPDIEKDPYNYVAAANLPSEMAKALEKMSLDDPVAAFAGVAAPATFGSAASMAPYAASNAYVSGTQSQAMSYANTHGMYGVIPQAMPMAYAPTGMTMVPYNGHVMMMTPLHPSQYGMSLQGGYSNELDEYGGPPSYNSYGHGRGRDNYRGSYGHRGGRGNNQRSLMGPSDWYDSKKPENVVNIDRIITGLDVRTTVMLRNIPNKMTQRELMQILNKIIFGKFDFVYLRIDFSNGCNVGYAFLNLLDPLDIILFVKAIANRRWEDFKSDKIAEVSYATIQGRDCLIQKFRNSSVMLEEEECRPKLYYTEGHPFCGQEEPFPPSDNQSKLKRSCENAEHIGLFAPAHGQHYRQEQRNRNSQWDRGTTLADRERGHRLGFGSNNRGDFDDNLHSNFNAGSHRGTFSRDRGSFDLVRSTAFRNGYNGERGGHDDGRGGNNGNRGGFEGGRNAAHRGGFGNGRQGAFNGGNNSFDNGPYGGFIGGNGGFDNGPQGGANGDFEDGSQGGSNGGADGAHGLAFAPHVRRPQDPRHGGQYRQY